MQACFSISQSIKPELGVRIREFVAASSLSNSVPKTPTALVFGACSILAPSVLNLKVSHYKVNIFYANEALSILIYIHLHTSFVGILFIYFLIKK